MSRVWIVEFRVHGRAEWMAAHGWHRTRKEARRRARQAKQYEIPLYRYRVSEYRRVEKPRKGRS